MRERLVSVPILRRGVERWVAVMCASAVVCAAGCSRQVEKQVEKADGIKLTAQNLVEISEEGLRGLAFESPTPGYPSKAWADKTTGVVVAAVSGDTAGRVTDVRILEAPSPECEESVRDAVRRWKLRQIRVDGASHPSNVEARLTFYFAIIDGKGVVLSPGEMKQHQARQPSLAGGKDVSAVPPVIREDEFGSLQRRSRMKVVDVREREAYAANRRGEAVNIPLDELPTRAEIVLEKSDHVVIDCVRSGSSQCEMAGDILRARGFARVSLLRKVSQ